MMYKRNPTAFNQLRLFKQMVKRVPAYSKFLESRGFNYEKVRTPGDILKVPTMDKSTYIDAFTLPELCWDGNFSGVSYIVNSSGSTGIPYFWPRNDESDMVSTMIYHSILKDTFKIGSQPTLIMNTFSQGSWIAGTEAFLAFTATKGKSMNITSINSGIDIDLITKQLNRLSENFENIIFTGYPPFIRDLFEVLQNRKILKPRHNIFVICGGESISEPWRYYVGKLLNDCRSIHIVSIYGMSDGGGIQAAETNLTQSMRREIFSNQNPHSNVGGKQNTALFEYDARLRHFSVSEQDTLLIHNKHGLPLFNYDTKDKGGIVKLPGASKSFVYLLGRSDYAQSLYGVLIYPEHIRTIIDSTHDPQLTGRFLMATKEDETMSQHLHIAVELKEITKSSPEIIKKQKALEELIYTSLPEYSSEFAKLKQSIGNKACPRVEIRSHGTIGYVKGKKHAWVKKS